MRKDLFVQTITMDKIFAIVDMDEIQFVAICWLTKDKDEMNDDNMSLLFQVFVDS